MHNAQSSRQGNRAGNFVNTVRNQRMHRRLPISLTWCFCYRELNSSHECFDRQKLTISHRHNILKLRRRRILEPPVKNHFLREKSASRNLFPWHRNALAFFRCLIQLFWRKYLPGS